MANQSTESVSVFLVSLPGNNWYATGAKNLMTGVSLAAGLMAFESKNDAQKIAHRIDGAEVVPRDLDRVSIFCRAKGVALYVQSALGVVACVYAPKHPNTTLITRVDPSISKSLLDTLKKKLWKGRLTHD